MKKKSIQILLLVLATVLVLIFFRVYINLTENAEDSHIEYKIDDGWNVEINDKEYNDVSMSSERFPLLNKGDVMVLRNTLPDTMTHHPVLVFRTVHSDIAVKVAGEMIYSSGQDEYDANKMVGYGYHYISIDESYAGLPIEIKLRVSENKAFASLETPYVADGDYVHRDFIVANRLKMPFMLFLVMFGLVIIPVSIFYWHKSTVFSKLFDISMFAVSIGIWSLCTSDIMRFFTYKMIVKNVLEYLCLYAAPIFVFSYFSDEVKNEGGKRYLIFKVIRGLLIAFTLVAIVLQAFNIVHLPALLQYGHILIGIAILFIIVRFFINLFSGDELDATIVTGFVFLALFVVIDMVRYNLKKYSTIYVTDNYSSVIYIGVLIFVITLIIDFCQRLFNNIYKRVEDETLTKLAYTDALTGLYNRHKCEEVMDEVDRHNWNYAAIGFDLNNLKAINDSMGHDSGDTYIKAFGNVLTEVFAKDTIVGRNGGDEFYVIVPQVEMLDRTVDEMLQEMEQKIELLNASHLNWRMSVAYGVCDYKEAGVGDIRKAFKIADKYMYKHKQEMKKRQANT